MTKRDVEFLVDLIIFGETESPFKTFRCHA